MFLIYDTMIGCYPDTEGSWMEFDNLPVQRSFFARLLGM